MRNTPAVRLVLARVVIVVMALVAAALGSTVVSTDRAKADTAPDPGTPATASADALPTVQLNGVVWSQVTVGNTVYAAGSFSQTWPAGQSPNANNQTPRANLLAYDIRTGNLITSFDHQLNAQALYVTASPDGSRVYVGGDFTTVDGITRNHIAAFDTATGALSTTFRPSISGPVTSIAATNSTVYAGGNFFSVGGVSRTRLAAFSATNGALLSWAPSADDRQVNAMVMSPDQSRVIVGGKFASLNGVSASGLGAVDATTGATLPFAINQIIRADGDKCGILHLSTDGQYIYGTGFAFGCGNFEGVFAAEPNTGATQWVAACHGDTYGTYSTGEVVYNVGHAHDCSWMRDFPETNPRTWHRALAMTVDAKTTNIGPDNYGWNFNGVPAPGMMHWYPTVASGTYTGSNQGPWSVSGNSQYVSLGGEFPRVNGQEQRGLTRFAVSSLATNKRPPVTTSSITPTVTSLKSGTARVAWQATWDYDNENLTYEVLRDGSNTPVGTVTQKSSFWKLPSMGFTDTGLAPGSTHTYRVRAVDPFNNRITSGTSNTVTVSSAATSTYANDVLADGASSYWRLGEPSGSTGYNWAGFSDLTEGSAVGHGSTGAITGDSNTASDFDGSNSGRASTVSDEDGPNVFSAEAWINTTTNRGGKIVGFGNRTLGSSSNSYDRHLYMDNAGRIIFGVYNNGVRTITSSQTYRDGQWHQIVGTLSGSGMALYIDGKRVGTDQGTTMGQPYRGYWRVGGDNLNSWPSRPSSSNFDGAIDEVAIYPTALSLAKVQKHYTNSGRSLNVPPPPTDGYGQAVYNDDPDLFWRLNEASGPTAADTSANAGSATYRGGVTYRVPNTVTGSDGTGVRLNGSDGLIVANGQTSNPSTYSEELWFNTTTSSGGKLVGFGNATSGTSSSYDRHVYMLDTGQLVFGTWTGTANTVTSPGSYNDGNWHHLVATQGSSGMRLYVDNQLVGTHAQTGAQDYSGYWRVGGDNTWGGATSNYFAGAIDEVAVYSSVLSPSQINSHWRASGVAVNQPPTAAITPNCTNLACAFDGSGSADADGTIASYSWDFGDGTTGTGVSPNHAYGAAGTYTARLTVTDNDGGTGTVTSAVTVTAAPNQAPVAAFTFACTNLACVFDGSGSADADGTIASYSWDFGDGTTGTGVSPNHTYGTAGDYTVTLTVTDNQSATGTVSHVVSPDEVVNPGVLAADDFNRTVANGFGTADTGGAWTSTGNQANLSVSGGNGLIELPNTSSTRGALLNSVSATDSDTTMTFASDKAGTGGGTYAYVIGRNVATNYQYRALVRLQSNNAVSIAVQRLNGSASATTISNGGNLAGVTYSPGMQLNVRFEVTGTNPTTLRLKVWPTATSEPAAWQITTTDSTSGLQEAGSVGLAAYLSGSSTNAPVVVRVSNFESRPSVA